MKRILIILIGLTSVYNVYAKEYIFNGYGISKQYSIDVSDDYKFSSYTSEGMWDDSNGDYGNEKCSGYVKQINKEIELEVICENINQNNEIFWNSRIRKSEKGGGVSIQSPVKDIFSISTSFPLVFNAGTGVTLSNDGAAFDGSQQVNQTISIGQDVGTTSDVTFNQVSTNSWVFGNPTTYSHTGISGSVNITGSLTTSGNVTVNGNMTVNGTHSDFYDLAVTHVSSNSSWNSNPSGANPAVPAIYVLEIWVGPDQGDKHFTHTQTNASSTWTVTHNLGKFPAVQAVVGNTIFIPDVEHINNNQLKIYLSSDNSGKAYCN